LADRYSSLVMENVINAAEIPGAEAFLHRVTGTVRCFIISGTPQHELERIVERRGWTSLFTAILGSPTSKQDHLLTMLERYALPVSGSVFIGDAMTDYQAALATGLRFIGIQGEIDFPEATPVVKDCHGLEAALRTYFSWESAKDTQEHPRAQ
jgi:phosphoglycolate phosphatase-like HAD superfamily hydrolase